MTTYEYRAYQPRAVNDVMRLWREQQATNVCLVAPTGSGKTFMGEEFVHRAIACNARALWLCHRIELVKQARAELERRHLGQVGCVHPDYPHEPDKPIQVATVQSMLARDIWPKAQLVVADEFHHYVATSWRAVPDHYRAVRTVGLTATPERSDGRPLGDICEEMVVAANYSELIAAKHILDCRLVVPPRELQGGIACSPVKAYQQWGEDKYGFVFCGSLDQVQEVTDEFNAAGIPAKAIVSETDTDERKRSLELLSNGSVRLVVNIYTCTEGVNVPRAKLCMLARGTGSALTYLQMAGRVLRPFRDETEAMLIDLHGSSLAHGFPTEDRVFSLKGSGGINRTANADVLRQCLACGHVWKSADGRQCPACGWVAPPKVQPPRIYNEELREIYRGDDTPASAKEKELVRLKAHAMIHGYKTGWVVKEYRKLFKDAVPMSLFEPSELEEYYERLVGIGKKKNRAAGWARGCFKSTFGQWPRRG